MSMLNVVVSKKTRNPGKYARMFKRIFNIQAVGPA